MRRTSREVPVASVLSTYAIPCGASETEFVAVGSIRWKKPIRHHGAWWLRASTDGFSATENTTHRETIRQSECGLFSQSLGEPEDSRVRGGPGRTRTCNQTVMSGESSPENPENIDE